MRKTNNTRLAGVVICSVFGGCGGSGADGSATLPSPETNLPQQNTHQQLKDLVAEVRAMAPANNHQTPGSVLDTIVKERGQIWANCASYAMTLLRLIEERGIQVQTRLAQTCLVPNAYDCHTLVEVLDGASGRWELFDPTIGAVPHVAQGIATLDEMRAATRSMNWSAISYEWVTPQGDQFARGYYLDYPLVFDNTYRSETPGMLSQERDLYAVQKFYVPTQAVTWGAYAVQCASGARSTQATVDGQPVTLSCDPLLGISYTFLATTITNTDGVVLAPQRFVF